MKPPRSSWTPKRDATLRHLWRIECLPVTEIAAKLGVGYDAVCHRADALKLCAHPRRSRPSDNLRVLRWIWTPRDFDFWRIKSDTEVSRA